MLILAAILLDLRQAESEYEDVLTWTIDSSNCEKAYAVSNRVNVLRAALEEYLGLVNVLYTSEERSYVLGQFRKNRDTMGKPSEVLKHMREDADCETSENIIAELKNFKDLLDYESEMLSDKIKEQQESHTRGCEFCFQDGESATSEGEGEDEAEEAQASESNKDDIVVEDVDDDDNVL